jgi:hypothetical protein
MKCFVFIDVEKIGEADLVVTDEFMGAIGGIFIPNGAYLKYQALVQDQCDQKGISNISDFNYIIALPECFHLDPAGGIGITDIQGISEIYIESAGLNVDQLVKFK